MDKEIIDFVYNSYPALHGKISRQKVENLLVNHQDNAVVVKDKEETKGVGFYYKLSDKAFEEIRNGTLDIGNPLNAVCCLRDCGRNIHFVLLVSKGAKIILRGLREVIKRESPKTISWFSPDMKEFFIRKINKGVM